MNRVTSVLGISLFLILAACNKPPVPENKNDDKEAEPSPYAGSWAYTDITMSNGTLMFGSSQVGTFTGTGQNISGSFEIREKPDSFQSEVSFTAVLQVNINQQNLQQNMEIPKNSLKGTWSVQNDKISFHPSDGSQIEVISSTENKIVMKGNFTQEVQVGQYTLDAKSDVQFTIEK
jgi:hypothetical protein